VTTLQDRAETVPIDVPTKAGKDARTGAEFLRDLERETTVSLRRDGSRWRWTQSRESRDGRGTARAGKGGET
jgi:hypothetical protein